jgi:uncharacterized protein
LTIWNVQNPTEPLFISYYPLVVLTPHIQSPLEGIIPKLHGAIDVDITATPFTTTLPIRRLKLGEKQHADILVVYIKIPELSVDIDLQRYTRLSKDTFLFEQVKNNLARKIETDKDGLVVTYPGLFKRI